MLKFFALTSLFSLYLSLEPDERPSASEFNALFLIYLSDVEVIL